MSRTRVYCGNLPSDARERDVEDIFAKYGKIVMCELKNRTNPPFAFLEFEDSRDAEDAVRGRDGYDMDGSRLRVEFTRSNGPRAGGGGFGGGGGYDDRERRDPRARAGGKRTPYRVIVSGLPTTGSWQDLKDHMREAGDVCFTDVFRDGTGVVEYSRRDDVHYAVRKLDDTKFKSHEGETSYIRVKEDTESRGSGGGRGRSRSRSPRRSKSRSPRRSPAYSPARGRSRSRSRSPRRSRSRS